MDDSSQFGLAFFAIQQARTFPTLPDNSPPPSMPAGSGFVAPINNLKIENVWIAKHVCTTGNGLQS
jgi:hypothetical protein